MRSRVRRGVLSSLCAGLSQLSAVYFRAVTAVEGAGISPFSVERLPEVLRRWRAAGVTGVHAPVGWGPTVRIGLW